MANKNPAQLDLFYSWTPSTSDVGQAGSKRQYIDVARDLSAVNRRFYEQNRNYVVRGITYVMNTNAAAGTVATFGVSTAANTWVVQNAHVKGEALWNQMRQLVLEDNPSIAGRWDGFRLQLDAGMAGANTLVPKNGDGTADVALGEWDYSTYVMPQHTVDIGTGEPLPAEELQPILIGADTTTKRSLVKAYEESRATVQPIDPSVPAGMPASFFNLLTDSGSQEPELALVIQDDNDEPPYDQANYPQGDGNNVRPIAVDTMAVTREQPVAKIGSFIAPCGLVQVYSDAVYNTNDEAQPVGFILHVAPGDYKGTMSVPMGQ
jgi:hypothetical protein